MKMPWQMHDYQIRAINFQCDHFQSAMWLDMGLGKTVVTLSSIVRLIKSGFLKAVLIVAPLKVCNLVWRQEAKDWLHTKQLKFTMLTGDRDQRTRALMRPSDIYLINYENLGWLGETLGTYYISKTRPIPFQGVVWDEISKMKNSSTQRVKSVMKFLPQTKWRTGLTGTPSSNGYKDLHGQYLVLDQGYRLGTSKVAFRNRFYKKDGSYKLKAYDDSKGIITEMIADITLRMSAEEYRKLPDLIIKDVMVELPEHARRVYDEMEKDLFAYLDNGTEITVFNRAALTGKCLQISGGSIYPISGAPEWEHVHDAKLDALEDIIDDANGHPVLCAYAFKPEAQRIMERFKKLDPINLTECKSERAMVNAMTRWVREDCQLMIGHPASIGFGVDGLQKTGHIIAWFGLTWSLDLYQQFIARLRRQGQGVPVICNRIIAIDTLDQAQELALKEKTEVENNLMLSIQEYRKRRGL